MGIDTVAVCFESGQHDDLASVDNAVAAIINCLRSVGCVASHNIENKHDERPGYKNFQWVKKNELLAQDKHGEIRSKSDGLILMPLYQKQGNDGFFLIDMVESF